MVIRFESIQVCDGSIDIRQTDMPPKTMSHSRVGQKLDRKRGHIEANRQMLYTVNSCLTLLVSSGRTVSMAVCLMNSSSSRTRMVSPLCIGLNSVYMFAKSSHTETRHLNVTRALY